MRAMKSVTHFKQPISCKSHFPQQFAVPEPISNRINRSGKMPQQKHIQKPEIPEFPSLKALLKRVVRIIVDFFRES
jgi:hypothetical protein